jgi:hypothetical protein
METTPNALPAPVAPVKSRKQQDLLRFGLFVLALFVLNFIAQLYFFSIVVLMLVSTRLVLRSRNW